MGKIRSKAKLFASPIMLIILLVQIFLYVFNSNTYSQLMMTQYGIIAILLVFYLNLSEIRLFSPFYIIVLYTVMSHFGFAFVRLINPALVDQYLRINRHVYLTQLPRALQIACIGIILMIMGYNSWRRRDKKIDEDNKEERNEEIKLSVRQKYIYLCTAIYYIYAITLLVLSISNNLFGANYSTVKRVLMSSSIITHMKTLFWVATIPLAVFIDKRVIKSIAIPAFIITFVLMFTGNRNDVLYPLAIGYSLYCYKNKKTNKWVNAIALIVLFVINPTIAENRANGDLLSASYSLNISRAIMEMGAQIRPLTVIIDLVSRDAISLMCGMTMIIPTLAELNLGILYSGSAYRSSLYYIPNILALDNHYGQGFSMISEFWLNFGIVGVAILCFFIGVCCAKYEKRLSNDEMLIKYGAWALLLFYWVRNSLMMNFEIVLFAYLMIFICKRVKIR